MATYNPPPRIELPPRPELIAALKQGFLLGSAVLVLMLPPDGTGLHRARFFAGPVLRAAAVVQPGGPRFADFRGEAASPEARHIADWVADSGDNQRLPYVILDKRDARVFVFDAQGVLLGATPVLLGAAVGDDSVIGIGNRAIAEVRPEERTTPAGRFVAERGRNATGEDVVWVDYNAAVSMHRVRAIEPSERRLERLASATPSDNRISYGCINVPVRFYEDVLRATFKASRGIVYVLPEVKPLAQVFASYNVAQKHGGAKAAALQPAAYNSGL
nr:hypothetical protein [uncultured Roseateles sp.]